jgi:KaiC/GvpD/RAD55 family RecA-like ATPase
MNNREEFQKDLGKETFLSKLQQKLLISSGLRELDEMMGGGFKPASLNLVQESLGCGGDLLCYKIAENQISLSNRVLLILTDPISEYILKRLKRFESEYFHCLDLVQLAKQDTTLMGDKHELSIKIAQAVDKLEENVEKSGEDYSDVFVLVLSLNPLLLNLKPDNVLEILYNNVLNALKSNFVYLILMQKDILSNEAIAQIQTLCHSVVDLEALETGLQIINTIRILKHVGIPHDIKKEHYTIHYDREFDKYQFLIRGDFLMTFETLRNLIKWQNGSIFLANVPYMLAPIDYFNSLLSIPLSINEEKGQQEILEKAQGIGRKLTSNTETMYFLSGFDLLKSTFRVANLNGWGFFDVMNYEPTENLLSLEIALPKEIHAKSYKLFLTGFIKGIVSRAINRNVRDIRFISMPLEGRESDLYQEKYQVSVRLVYE